MKNFILSIIGVAALSTMLAFSSTENTTCSANGICECECECNDASTCSTECEHECSCTSECKH